jgi:peroxiredoxin
VATAALAAEAELALLRTTADYYRKIDSFDAKGHVFTDFTGTSWRFLADFESTAAEPLLFPRTMPITTRQSDTSVTNFHLVQVDPLKHDPAPKESNLRVPLAFGRYTQVDKNVLTATSMGTEILQMEGEQLPCEVLEVIYDVSPGTRPNSRTEKVRYWINPSKNWILKEARPNDMGPEKSKEWIAVVDSMTVHNPAPETLVNSIAARMAQKRVRPEWVGRSIPDLVARDLDGHNVNVASFRTKATLLDFWGSYCVPCKRTTAKIEQIARDYRALGLAAWGITQDSSEDARAWLAANRLSLPTLLDPDSTLFKAFEVGGIPVTILLNSDGRIVKYWIGEQDENTIREEVKKLLH